jgi:hypothetical protein
MRNFGKNLINLLDDPISVWTDAGLALAYGINRRNLSEQSLNGNRCFLARIDQIQEIT